MLMVMLFSSALPGIPLMQWIFPPVYVNNVLYGGLLPEAFQSILNCSVKPRRVASHPLTCVIFAFFRESYSSVIWNVLLTKNTLTSNFLWQMCKELSMSQWSNSYSAVCACTWQQCSHQCTGDFIVLDGLFFLHCLREVRQQKSFVKTDVKCKGFIRSVFMLS